MTAHAETSTATTRIVINQGMMPSPFAVCAWMSGASGTRAWSHLPASIVTRPRGSSTAAATSTGIQSTRRAAGHAETTIRARQTRGVRTSIACTRSTCTGSPANE